MPGGQDRLTQPCDHVHGDDPFRWCGATGCRQEFVGRFACVAFV